jgi:hypothetical protein
VPTLTADDCHLPLDIHVCRAARPYPCHDQGKKQSSCLFCEANTTSALFLHRSSAIFVSHRCPTQVVNEFSAGSSAPVHLSSSPSHALTSCLAAKSRSRRRVPCHPKHLPGTGLRRPFLDPLDPTPSFTQPRNSSLTTPTPSVTTTPACRPSSPITSSLCRGQAPPGEPPPLRYPKSVLPPCWLAPRTLSATPSYRQSPDSSWPSPPGEAQRLPLFSPSGRKCRVGRATSLAGWAVSLLAGAVHCNSGVSLLYFELIQNSLQI